MIPWFSVKNEIALGLYYIDSYTNRNTQWHVAWRNTRDRPILQSSPQHGAKHTRRHQQHDNLMREISVSGTEYLTRPGLEMKLVIAVSGMLIPAVWSI